MELYFIFLISSLIIIFNIKAHAKYLGKFTREERFFEIPLDHFDIQNEETVKLRYFELIPNTDYNYTQQAPILIEIVTRGGIPTPMLLATHPSFKLADELNATLILIEPRFYGSDKLSDEEYMPYLNTEQILEDFAMFIKWYRKKQYEAAGYVRQFIPVYKKVGVFGCSYAGSLATWMRYKHPHLVDAAWASSAPLHATEEYNEFYDVVEKMYREVSEECYRKIQTAYRKISQLIVKSRSSMIGSLRVKLGIPFCGKTKEWFKDSKEEVLHDLRLVLSNPYNRPIDYVILCDFLNELDRGIDVIDALAAILKIYSSHGACAIDKCEPGQDPYDYTRMFQVCTEFGSNPAATSSNQLFIGHLLSYDRYRRERICHKMFPNRFLATLQRSIKRKNRLYGSKFLPVRQVFFIYGTYDPWYKLGYHKHFNYKPIRFVVGSSHCADMPLHVGQIGAAQYKPLVDAKNYGMNYMRTWLKTESVEEEDKEIEEIWDEYDL